MMKLILFDNKLNVGGISVLLINASSTNSFDICFPKKTQLKLINCSIFVKNSGNNSLLSFPESSVSIVL